MQTNYHGHTKWCKHATGSTEEVIVKAIEEGYEEIAISEHAPQLVNGKFTKVRMSLYELEEFFTDLNLQIENYQDKIKIYKALECEYFENSLDWYDFLQTRYNIDYLVLGHHFNEKLEKSYFFCENDEDVKNYELEVLKALDTKKFLFFAHPDVYLNSYPLTSQGEKTARAIFQKCEDLKIPVEINTNGLRGDKGYPNKDFWTISKEYELQYIINADAHAIDHLADPAIEKTYEFAKNLNIEITEKLKIGDKI